MHQAQVVSPYSKRVFLLASLKGEDETAKRLRHAEKGAPRARGRLTGAFYGEYEGRVRPEDIGRMPQEPEAQR